MTKLFMLACCILAGALGYETEGFILPSDNETLSLLQVRAKRFISIQPEPALAPVRCGTLSGYQVYLNANQPKNSICNTASSGSHALGGSYTITAKIYNIKGSGGTDYGHPGIGYNARDADNFDFVYFRPHSDSGCFQTGQMINGVAQWNKAVSGTCNGGGVRGKVWFDVRIEVDGGIANIYKNEVLVRTQTNHFEAESAGTMMAWNTYQNDAFFKDFQIVDSAGTHILQESIGVSRCSLDSGYQLYLDADKPDSSICNTVAIGSSGTASYTVTAKWYNINGWLGQDSGHPGIGYNARDSDNFDFVYFRPHNDGSCFQTGQMIDGVASFNNGVTSACHGGGVRGGKWYDIKISVDGGVAKIYKGNALVHTQTNYFEERMSGTMLVWNSYTNTAFFKDFEITANCNEPVELGPGTLTHSNLGGNGPDTGVKTLRYAGVATVNDKSIDLVIKSLGEYGEHTATNGHAKGGLIQKIAQAPSTTMQLEFSFVDADDKPVTLDKFAFTFFDIDGNSFQSMKELVSVCGATNYFLSSNTKLLLDDSADAASGCHDFEPQTFDGFGNPTDPQQLTDYEREHSVSLVFTETSKFEVTSGFSTEGKNTRPLLFAGVQVHGSSACGAA